MHDLNFTKRAFAHGVYHYTLSVARVPDDPPAYRVLLDRSSSDRTQTARVTEKQYPLPESTELYARLGEMGVTARLLDYLQKLVQNGQPLPDELRVDWQRDVGEC